jgi:putative ABC transport system permease protein
VDRHLIRLAARNLAARRVRTAVTGLGIVLGVAAVVAVAVTSASTQRSLEELFAQVAGRADLSVESVDREAGMRPSAARRILALAGVRAVVGSVFEFTELLMDEPTPVLVVGVDAERDALVRAYTLTAGRFLSGGDRSGLVVIGEALASEHDLRVGQRLTLKAGSEERTFEVAGVVADKGAGHLNRGAVAFVPLQVAQEAFERGSRVDRFDLVADGQLRPSQLDGLRERLRAELGPEYNVASPSAAGRSVAELLDGLHTGLSILSVIALFVGALLIYNTFSMTIAERIRELGALRAIGATRRQLMVLMLLESGLLGTLGSLIGMGCGLLLAVPLMKVMSNLIEIELDSLALPGASLAQAMGAGLTVTLVAAAIPAAMAARLPPVQALGTRSVGRAGWSARLSRGLGLAVLLVVALDRLAGVLPDPAFFVLSLLGGTLLIPSALTGLETVARRLAGAVYGRPGELAARNVGSRNLGRASLTVSVLMASLVMTVLIGGLRSSFNRALTDWLDHVLGGDLHVEGDGRLPVQMSRSLEAVPGVEAATPLRYTTVRLTATADQHGVVPRDEALMFEAIEPGSYFRVASFQFESDDVPDEHAAVDLARGGAVFVSTVLAEQYGLKRGDAIRLRTAAGEHDFRVAGIVLTFDRVGRAVIGSWRDLVRLLHRSHAHSFMLRLHPDADATEVQARIQRGAGRHSRLRFESAASLRRSVAQDLNEFFTLFNSILVIALVVSALGVVNTMTMNILERVREIGALRAAGMTRRQIGSMVLAEAAAMGLVASLFGALMAVPVSVAMLHSMGRATGFSFEYVLPGGALLGGGVMVLAITQLAAVYPMWRAARLDIVRALQYE